MYSGCSLWSTISKSNMILVLLMLSKAHQILCLSTNLRINASCKPPRGEACVEIRDCPYFIELLDKSRIPRPRYVVRAIRERQCGFTGITPKVCCSYIEKHLTEQLVPVTEGSYITTSKMTNITSNTAENAMFSMVSASQQHKNEALLSQMKCGIFISGYRIMSGIKTAVGEFPWMALIASNTDDDGLDFRCAATLISQQYVLTAAHCVTDVTIISVRLGEHNVNNDIDCDWKDVKCSNPTQDIKIDEVIVHPNYFAKNFANDIALIRLATKVNFTDYIQPICLPIGGLTNFNLDGKFAVITGWGVTESGFRSPELLKTLVPIVPNEQCARIYERHANISVERQLCAGGYRGRDSCGGDSGGPLKQMAPFNDVRNQSVIRYVQFGIVSYGPRHCGIEGHPGVYTKVTYYIDWIMDNLRS